MTGAQAPLARVPLADGTLVATQELPPDDLIASLLATSDVLGTGWYAADAARVQPGSTVVVVGDGAVGLMGVLAANRMGAGRIIAMSRHKTRQDLALVFGATDIVSERGDGGVDRIKQLTDGIGADSVLECVGTKERFAPKGGLLAMSNFRDVDRQTAFLLPPSVDEWLPRRHLARFVVEVIDGLDLGGMIGAYRGSGSAAHHPGCCWGF